MVLTVLLLVAAPLSVVLTLSDLRLTFLVYHLLLCLVVPFIHSKIRRCSWREHLNLLGLTRPSRAVLVEGAATGLAMAIGTVIVFSWSGSALLEPVRVARSMTAWGVDPSGSSFVLVVMLLLNGPAEELFWRGWVHGRLAHIRSRTLALGIATTGYASYHLVTLHALISSTGARAIAFAGILLAGAGGPGAGSGAVRFGARSWPIRERRQGIWLYTAKS